MQQTQFSPQINFLASLFNLPENPSLCVWTYIASSAICEHVLVNFMCVRPKVDLAFISFLSFLRPFVLPECLATNVCSSIIFSCLFPFYCLGSPSPSFAFVTTLCCIRTTFRVIVNHNIVLSQSFFIGWGTNDGWLTKEKRQKEKGNSKRKTR